MKKYKVSWIDRIGLETIVEAESEDKVRELFDTGQIDTALEPDGFVETEYDSLNIEVVEDA